MKALNRDEVVSRLRSFILLFLLLIATSVISMLFFKAAVASRSRQLVAKDAEYKQLLYHHTDLSRQLDTIYSYLEVLNTEQAKNNSLLMDLTMNKTNNARITLLSTRDSAENFKLSHQLVSNLSYMLEVKDSIGIISSQLNSQNNQLRNCNTMVSKVKAMILRNQ